DVLIRSIEFPRLCSGQKLAHLQFVANSWALHKDLQREESMKRTTILIFLFALLLAALMNAQELVDTVMAGRIRAEGFEHSQVMEVFDHLVNVIGPRLTASPAYQTAVTWTRDRLVNMGFDNVHLEPWEFGRGWQVERISVEMLEPRYMPMIAYASGWSPSTNG